MCLKCCAGPFPDESVDHLKKAMAAVDSNQCFDAELKFDYENWENDVRIAIYEGLLKFAAILSSGEEGANVEANRSLGAQTFKPNP